jgi:Ala-tRNA(Pro) deacylase
MTMLTDYLEREDIAYQLLHHERTFTGIDEARALGVEADEVLKTLILDTKEGHVAVVLPSGERLDMRLVREVLDDPDAALASETEISGDFAGFELGALPPVAPLLGVETIVDATVRDHGPVVFAAGTQTESVKVEARDLFASQPVRFAQVAEVWNEGRS